MKRRKFLKDTAIFSAIPLTLSSFALRSLKEGSLWHSLAAKATNTDHVLVIIELNGGNDGLNTIIPIDQYANLNSARNNVLALNGVTNNAFHPSLVGMKNLFNDGKLQVIQNVGYANPNYSHFRSSDIWLSGSNSDEYYSTGFLGRYLNNEYPNFPSGYPNQTMPDPLGIQVGSFLSYAFQGPAAPMGSTISDPSNVYNASTGIQDAVPNTCAGPQLEYVRVVNQQASSYSKVISAAAAKVTNHATYPANNELADKLKVVSKLIKGGLKTRVYFVSLGGFDTHSNQTDKTDKTIGVHANLLKTLSEAVDAFQKDLIYQGIEERVMGMTISEFGRRIKSNDSNGTDHGAAAPMFTFGKNIDGGKILGTNPIITNNVGVEDNLNMEYDFRRVYASVLEDWFCLSKTDVDAVLQRSFSKLNIFKTSCNTSGINEYKTAGKSIITAYPNPFQNSFNITFQSIGGILEIDVLNLMGQKVSSISNNYYLKGEYILPIDPSQWSSGTYFVRIKQNELIQSVQVVKI
jgi:uncharacterized protein (DUF1501 family)